MRLLQAVPILFLPAWLAAQAAPEVPSSGIVSAADNSSAGPGLARGSIFTIYGRNLAETTSRAEGGAPPLTLGGARVRFQASGVETDAPLLYASPFQINAIVPSALTADMAAVSVVTAAGESQAQQVAMVDARFTAFTATGRPFGPAVIQDYGTSGITLNRFLNPALAGDALVIWGTGLGGRPREDAAVFIGLVPVQPFYAGPAPGLPGVDQINLIVPEGLMSRCFLPFLVRAGGRDSPVYTLSAGTQRGSCATEVAIGPAGLEALDRGGTVRMTVLTVQSDGEGRQSAEAWTGEYDAAYLSVLATHDWEPAAAPVTCSQDEYSYNRLSPPRAILLPGLYGMRRSPEPVAVAITGPGNCAWSFTRSGDGVYRAIAPGCPPLQYSIGDPNRIPFAVGAFPADGPSPPAPEIELTRADDGASVSWRNLTGTRLTLNLSSSFVLPGNIFNGQTDVRELSCRLSGYSGSGRISPRDLEWALGLPSSRFASYRLWLTGLLGGSWSGPDHALLIRITRMIENRLPLP